MRRDRYLDVKGGLHKHVKVAEMLNIDLWFMSVSYGTDSDTEYLHVRP